MSAEKTYRIGAVAQMLRLKEHVLRFWEKEFPQVKPLRTEKGHRVYTEEQVATLRLIQKLRHEQGMTIEGAKRILEGNTDENAPNGLSAPMNPLFMEMIRNELLEIRNILAMSDEQ